MTGNTWITLYTDASWYTEAEIGGWGFWARSPKGRLIEYGKLPEWVKCNNSAEMAAILIGVTKIFKTYESEVDGILVCTDSKTAIDYLKYRPQGVKELRRKDWLFIRNNLYTLLENHDCKLRMKYVKGHQQSKTLQAWLNNKVDELTRNFK